MSSGSQRASDTQEMSATHSKPATVPTKPKERSPASENALPSASPPANVKSTPNRTTPANIHSETTSPTPGDGDPALLTNPFLRMAAEVLDDLERVRIANENRLRQLTRSTEDSDGGERGFGLPLDDPDVKRLATLVEQLGKVEHEAELNLKRHMRAHQLGPWVEQAKGVGEKQAARLLATIGDPYWNDLHERPRTVSELWAYSGYHVLLIDQTSIEAQGRGVNGHSQIDTQVSHAGQDDNATQSRVASNGNGHGADDTQKANADQQSLDTQEADVGHTASVAQSSTADQRRSGTQGASVGQSPLDAQSDNADQPASDNQKGPVGIAASRARGQKMNWSPDAKMRAHLVAVSIVKAGGPYREVYDKAREKYENSVHRIECKRCGPAGKPAQVGSPISAGHQHARALRIVAKEVLKDLWRESKRIHELQ